MAFVYNSGDVVTFASYEDALARDDRLFDVNEALPDADTINALLVRATDRILVKIRATSWWVDYYINQSGGSFSTVADIPVVDPNLILDRQDDFSDLCVYYAFYDYILPLIAKFGDEEDSSFNKIEYYTEKYNGLFDELITAGDWYDFNNDGVIASSEKSPGIRLVDTERMVRIR